MIRLILSTLTILWLLASPGIALAECSTITFIGSDGRTVICTTCCLSGSCQTTCT